MFSSYWEDRNTAQMKYSFPVGGSEVAMGIQEKKAGSQARDQTSSPL